MQVACVCLSQMYMICDDVTCTYDDVTQVEAKFEQEEGRNRYLFRMCSLIECVLL